MRKAMVKIRCTRGGVEIEFQAPTVLGPKLSSIVVPYEEVSRTKLILYSVKPEFSEDGSFRAIILDVSEFKELWGAESGTSQEKRKSKMPKVKTLLDKLRQSKG
jgi:hypothetical protein